MTQSITDIPAAQVGQVVQDFIDDGSVNVFVELAENGTYTVSTGEASVTTFPDSPSTTGAPSPRA